MDRYTSFRTHGIEESSPTDARVKPDVLLSLKDGGTVYLMVVVVVVVGRGQYGWAHQVFLRRPST